MKEDRNFSHRWDLVVAGAAWSPPVCCTLERGGFLFMSKDVEWKLRQERGVFGVKQKDLLWESRKRSTKEEWNFSHRWDLVVAGAACSPPVCCTLERGGILFMSKDVDWKLRQERGVFGVEAEGRFVEVEKEEHEERLKFQPSVDLVYAAAAWNFPVCCILERYGFVFMSKDMEWKLRQERGVFDVEAEGCAVEVEEEEHKGRLEFQPSLESGRRRGSLEPFQCAVHRKAQVFCSCRKMWIGSLNKSVES